MTSYFYNIFWGNNSVDKEIDIKKDIQKKKIESQLFKDIVSFNNFKKEKNKTFITNKIVNATKNLNFDDFLQYHNIATKNDFALCNLYNKNIDIADYIFNTKKIYKNGQHTYGNVLKNNDFSMQYYMENNHRMLCFKYLEINIKKMNEKYPFLKIYYEGYDKNKIIYNFISLYMKEITDYYFLCRNKYSVLINNKYYDTKNNIYYC
jgi:hypothetical protein